MNQCKRSPGALPHEGNYWGHNAIIRVRSFAMACGLPELPGRRPLGGEILSHDFVEAALLRRGGFAVYSLPDIVGSYEQTPPTLREHVARDRRWAHGNFQHSKIVPAAGLHWLSRFHLVNGIMSYLASPLWLMFLITGVVLSWEAEMFPPDYFPSDFALFPTWPRFDPQRALALLEFSIVVLLLPKLFGLMHGLILCGNEYRGTDRNLNCRKAPERPPEDETLCQPNRVRFGQPCLGRATVLVAVQQRSSL